MSESSEPKSATEIASRAIRSSAWSVGGSFITIASGFTRSVLLARFLTPSDFGIVALALVFGNLVTVFITFGYNAGLIQYKGDIQAATSTHFILRLGLAVVVTILAIAAAPLVIFFYPDQPQLAPVLVAILAFRVIAAANSTPESLLQRRLEFKRLTILTVMSSLAMTIIAPLLALAGWGVWSLVIGEQGISVIVSAFGLWAVYRVWRIQLRFSPAIAKHYVRFGFHIMLSRQLTYWLDQFDDFWTGTVLGDRALGFYSKAYEFARYPRRVVAQPLEDVFYATYTRLQDDRLRLSKAYYRASSLVVRTGFLFSVVFILVATEFVTILLGEKWLTMVTTFQLMVIYCLLDPLIVTSARLATAAGHPEVLTKTKAVQIVIFTPLVIAGAHFYGIEGVALAADVMVSVGFVLIIGQIRRFVDFSITRMFAVPVLAMVLAAIGSVSATYLLRPQSTWLAFLTKGIVATTIYLLTLFLLERTEYRRMLALVYQNVIRAGFLHKGDT